MVQALGSNIQKTAEYGRGVVRSHVVVYGVMHPYQMWFMTNITLMKWWDCIFIPT